EVEVKFYGKDDIKEITDILTVQKLLSDGFAVASDGSIWVNTKKLENNTLDFNRLLAHELGHLMGGNETVANYMEKSYGEFVGGVGASGYVDISGSIRDWGKNPLNGEDANRLLGYREDEIDFKIFTMTKKQAEELKTIIWNIHVINRGLHDSWKDKKETPGIISGDVLEKGNKSFIYNNLFYFIKDITPNEKDKEKVDVDIYLLGSNTGHEEKLLDQFMGIFYQGEIKIAVARQYDSYDNYAKTNYSEALEVQLVNDVDPYTIATGRTISELRKSKVTVDEYIKVFDSWSNAVVLTFMGGSMEVPMDDLGLTGWGIQNGGRINPGRNSFRLEKTPTTFTSVELSNQQNLSSIRQNLNNKNNSKSSKTEINKGYTSDQRAVIELAKEAKAQGGLKADAAKTLQKWANEYGVPNHGPEIHLNRPGAASNVWHIHIGKTGHIQIID
ncbi:hypothetical protein, partial [Fusobacterium sp. PH5-44]